MNLCGNDAAACCTEAITFFGKVQKVFNFSIQVDATPEFPEKRKQTENQKELRLQFKENVFMKVLNSVNEGMKNRFTAVNKINSLFGFLWTYTSRTEEALKGNCKLFSDKYPDVSAEELPEEIRSLKSIHESNFGSVCLAPLVLLNRITEMGLESLYPNVSIAIRIFLTLPVTVVSSERSFSKLKLVKITFVQP